MRRREILMFGFRGFPQIQEGSRRTRRTSRHVLRGSAKECPSVCGRRYVDPGLPRELNGVRVLRVWTARNTYLETLLHSLICALVAGVRRPGLVHVHGIGPAIVTPLLRAFGLRVVVTHHGEDYNREKWGWAARTVRSCRGSARDALCQQTDSCQPQHRRSHCGQIRQAL